MDQIFYRPIFPLFDAPWVGGLPYMLVTCRGGPGPISLSIAKIKILIKFDHPSIVGQNGPNFWSAYFPLIWCPLSWGPALHAGNSNEALVLLAWALKRLKISIKFDHPGPVGQNGPNFLSAYFPLIWCPLSRGPALHAGNLQGRPWSY